MTTERSRRRGDRRDRGDRQKDEEKRGRSRDRREKKKGRSRDRGRRRETDKSHGSKPLLVPAETAPPPAPSADAAAPKASHDDEEGEEESVLAEDPPVQPPAKRAAPESPTREAAKAARPGPAKAEAVARREGDQPPHQGETSERDQGHKPDEEHKSHQAWCDDKRHQGGKTTTRLVGMTAASAAAKSEVELPARGNIAGQLTIWLLMSTGTTKRPFPGRIVSRKGNAGACTSGRRTKQVRRMTHCPTSLRKSKGLQFQ